MSPLPSSSPSPIGRTLGPYRVDALIGHGGMGSVYRATDLRLRRTVALKTIRAEYADRPEARARLEREARAAAALSHPNIATLHDFGEVDGITFLVFEYIPGRSLRELQRERRLGVAEVLEIALPIARALTAAHAAGIVHRDIKPENILIDGDSVKVLDFGLARIEQPTVGFDSETDSSSSYHTSAGAIVGTPHYMAPEQLEGRDVDQRTDLFALGDVIYELATGQLPFAANSSASEISNILRCTPTPPSVRNPEVPAELDRVILKLLRREAGQRYQSAADLVVDLEAIKAQLAGQTPAGGEVSEPLYYLGRSTARALFLAIQLLYLVMYFAAFRYAEALRHSIDYVLGGVVSAVAVDRLQAGVLLLALVGIGVRLYLVALVAVDHVQTGVQFRRAFGWFAVLDWLWALTPILLIKDFDLWGSLPCIPPLVFLPFSQRTLIRSAYDMRQERRASSSSGSSRPL